jgi:mono/diheme cytochrome c family protein
LLGVAASFLLAVCVSADQAASATPPLTPESLRGADSYWLYCSSCHGTGGRGDGPLASELRQRPADLTLLSQKHEGQFPRKDVLAYVDGSGRPVAAHGSGDMPVWGTALRGLDASAARRRVRLENLVAFVESLQRTDSQSLQRGEVQADRALPRDGRALFTAYCASCHGPDARGAGAMTAQLKTAPPDLTRFARRNGGVFPAERVRQMVDGRGPAAHGSIEMPVWGDVFQRKARGESASARIDALVRFLESIQERPAE